MLPREKFLKRGISSLSNLELLSIIISNGIKGQSFLSISEKVYQRIKKLPDLGNITVTDFEKISGLGKIKIMKILSGIELGRRIYTVKSSDSKVITNTETAYEEIKYIGKYKQERLIAIFLNARFEFLKKSVISIGTLDRISTNSRDIVIPALELNCAYVIIGHNHPSGDPSPSEEDFSFTKSLKEALDLVGIQLLEHIIIGKNDWSRVDI
ncbi:MAG TPA: DNA repair protein RadC [Candidatus Dojkabacteria bacterium]|nr:DNA repair protein RadC [Candidatus Dojkabacteria bacterium]